MAHHTFDSTSHSLEFSHNIGLTSPLVHYKSTSFGRYHNVAILRHVKHVSYHVLFLIEQTLVAEMMRMITYFVYTDFLKRPCKQDVHLSIHGESLDPISNAIKSLKKL